MTQELLTGSVARLFMAANGSWQKVSVRPTSIIMRSVQVTVTIEILQKRMDEAVAALDFEEASRCRDMINAMRGGATSTEAEEASFEGLQRQRSGAMGLGTSQQRVSPPVGWRPPPKPDPMTVGRSRRGRDPKL